MTSNKRIGTGHAKLTAAAEEGVKLLWSYQLRKENAALLERLEANERIISDRAEVTNRHFQEMNEKVEVLEERLSKIESEEEKDKKAIDDWGAAVRTLKRKIESSMERPRIATGTPSHNLNRAVELPKQPPIAQPNLAITDVSTRQDNSGTHASSNMGGTSNNFSTPQTAPEIEAFPPPTHRVAARRSSSHKALSECREPAKPRILRNRPAGKVQAAKPRRLIQGTGQLATYFNNATAAFYTMPDDMKEVEFVSAFLGGLREPKQRDILIEELQKAHLCRKGKDGRMVINCKWGDVAKELIKTKLLPPDITVENPLRK